MKKIINKAFKLIFFNFKKHQLNTITFLLLIFFSFTTILKKRFYPSIIFPGFSHKYSYNETEGYYLKIDRKIILDENNNRINLYDLQQPKEIHNYLYLIQYLNDSITEQNALRYIQNRYSEKHQLNKQLKIVNNDTIIYMNR